MDAAPRIDALPALRRVLEQARIQRRTLTYLQVADALALAPPRRIHRVTRLVERLMREQVAAGEPPLSALVISRVRDGLPAPGFFALAERLGVVEPGQPPEHAHACLLDDLFGTRTAA